MQRTYLSGAVDGQILSAVETSVRGFQNRVFEAVESYKQRSGLTGAAPGTGATE